MQLSVRWPPFELPSRIIGQFAVFLAAATRDRITDFVHLSDKINLISIDAKAHAIGNNAFTFHGTLPFNGEGQVRVVQSGPNTIVEVNTTGTTGAEMTIQLDNVTAAALTAADFIP